MTAMVDILATGDRPYLRNLFENDVFLPVLKQLEDKGL